MFKGSITALITPFKNGKVDEEKFQSFVDWQINEGSRRCAGWHDRQIADAESRRAQTCRRVVHRCGEGPRSVIAPGGPN